MSDDILDGLPPAEEIVWKGMIDVLEVRSGVLLGAGAKILGNVEIGEGAKVGAGSVVLKDVPPHTSVAGVPAEIIGKASEVSPALGMCHKLD